MLEPSIPFPAHPSRMPAETTLPTHCHPPQSPTPKACSPSPSQRNFATIPSVALGIVVTSVTLVTLGRLGPVPYPAPRRRVGHTRAAAEARIDARGGLGSAIRMYRDCGVPDGICLLGAIFIVEGRAA